MKNYFPESTGICVGASTVSVVSLKLTAGSLSIDKTNSIPHHGNPKTVVGEILKDCRSNHIAVTGRKFRNLLNLSGIPEPEAVEIAYDFLNYSADIIISIGGENFIVYEITNDGHITKPYTGNKCASGTGEFFLQQIKRMNLSADEAARLALEGDAYEISGRCSVFCKSDCTHALNKGVNKADVTAGLTKMMAQKIIELTAKSEMRNALLIGGVAQNKAVMNHLYDSFDSLIIPEEAPYFEALGAALYAAENKTIKLDFENLFKSESSSFSFFDALSKHENKVSFKSFEKGTAEPNDEVVLGLDVGSTTTKAILLRVSDNTIVASEYLRTNGNPVQASTECYRSIQSQITVPINIIGLGVTGSGRYISGLHAQTKGIINEIIAHASATVYFDDEVDTIFEIGGQDAKYTYITAGVPSDYAMNEACSAGTGSFLEEAAKESLNVDFTEISEIAMTANRAPNFNDQCSAFISSDIKNALHEGLSQEEIVAGLVYSICLNYTNRVMGNRPVGRKVFMQGGVCYNKAVPIAMAALTGKEIIVPPEPGLMGAFGVALEIKKRIELGLMESGSFELIELIDRKVEYSKSFECAGGSDKCDLKCSISMININGKKYPFGGACNKYYSLQTDIKNKVKGVNLVRLRQELVFDKYIHPMSLPADAKVIGIPKSFLMNTFYPLYYNFFTQLGFKVILGDVPEQSGIEKQQAAFCYPVELAHGFIQDVINKKPDCIFIPHTLEVYNEDSEFKDSTCVLVQSENFYLRAAFKNQLKGIEILSPEINFSDGYEAAKDALIKLAKGLGCSKPEASASFDFAVGELNEMLAEFKSIGRQVIAELESDKNNFAVVLVGRAYSAFAKEANLGIPQKFSSRNVTIIPLDFLEVSGQECLDHMYWGTGRQILKTAHYVKNHPQLYASYITNFSCGPDSFIITYFRNIMGSKPSLTLELDSHSADAGLNTRIEAFLDIVRSYRQLGDNNFSPADKDDFKPLTIDDKSTIIDSENNKLSIFDPAVKMIIPNMGRYMTSAVAAAFRHIGINTESMPVYSFDTLKLGRGSTTCKECLPLILTAGTVLEYYNKTKAEDEKTLVFIPTGDGPCRLGQYRVSITELINKKKLKNIGVYSLSDEDSYEGLGNKFDIRSWKALLIGDIFNDISSALNAIAVNKVDAKIILEDEWQKIIESIVSGTDKQLYEQLEKSAEAISQIKTTVKYDDAPKIALIGEIFVRNEEFSRVDLIEKLNEKNVIVKTAPVSEFVHYANYLIKAGYTTDKYNFRSRLKYRIKKTVQINIEKKVRKILARSGFCESDVIDIEIIINSAKHLVSPALTGEAILTVGSALHEILNNVSGVISIGPFGCMPSRVAESILNIEMNLKGKEAAEGRVIESLSGEIDELPFLAIETDGNLFPQIIQSKIEVFLLQANRLHEKLQSVNEKTKAEYLLGFKNLIDSKISGYTEKLSQPVINENPEIASETE